MFCRQRQAGENSSHQESCFARRLPIAIDRVHSREHEGTNGDVGGDKRTMGDQVRLECEPGEGEYARRRSEHLARKSPAHKREKNRKD